MRRRVLPILVIPVISALAASAAGAQVTSSLAADGAVNPAAGTPPCVSPLAWQSAPVAQQITGCAAGGVGGTSFSSATFTTLRASASLTGDGRSGTWPGARD